MVYFLAAMLHSEVERLLYAYMNQEDITISFLMDRLNSVRVHRLHGDYYFEDWNREQLERYKSLYEEAGITECDLMDYAKRVMANPDYFAEEEEDDDW